MTAAGNVAPGGVGAVNKIGPVRKGAQEREREPVTNRFTHMQLCFYVVRKMRECIALRFPAFISNGFVAAGERDRLERNQGGFIRGVESELHGPAHLLVVDALYH